MANRKRTRLQDVLRVGQTMLDVGGKPRREVRHRSRLAGHPHGLRVEIFLESLEPVFAPHSALLVAAER